MITEDVLRAEFERQHKGRALGRHRMRGTYLSANIAALWNQHKRTAEWIASLATQAPTVVGGATADASEDARDAARYRWVQNWYRRGGALSEIDPHGHIRVTTPEIMNASIDAAISAMAPQDSAKNSRFPTERFARKDDK